MRTAKRPSRSFASLCATTIKQSLARRQSGPSTIQLLTLLCGGMLLSVLTCRTSPAASFAAADLEGWGYGSIRYDGRATETVMDQDMSRDFLNYWLKEGGNWQLYGNQPSMIPMLSFDFSHGGWNGLNIYLYDCASETMNTVKQNTYDSHGASLSADDTMIVYTEGWRSDPYKIKIYDIASGSSTAIATGIAELAAYFDKGGKILFIHSGTGVLKKMDTDGTNITAVANPEPPYSFGMFWMSPDRERIVVTEGRQEGPDYDTGHYERLVLMNSDGTGRMVIEVEYLG